MTHIRRWDWDLELRQNEAGLADPCYAGEENQRVQDSCGRRSTWKWCILELEEGAVRPKVFGGVCPSAFRLWHHTPRTTRRRFSNGSVHALCTFHAKLVSDGQVIIHPTDTCKFRLELCDEQDTTLTWVVGALRTKSFTSWRCQGPALLRAWCRAWIRNMRDLITVLVRTFHALLWEILSRKTGIVWRPGGKLCSGSTLCGNLFHPKQARGWSRSDSL